MIKRKGEKGSPCLNPLVGEINPYGLPLMRMEKEEEEMQAEIPIPFDQMLFQVHFEKHKALFAFLSLESLCEFMCKDGVVLNVPVWHKSRLERRGDLRENFLQSIGKDFRDDFVGDVA